VDPHTHKYLSTGVIDSKFGIPLAQGAETIAQAMALPNVRVVGLHFHLGSLIHETQPYRESIHHVLALAAEMKQAHGFELQELDVGGGFTIQYTVDNPAPPISFYAEAIASEVKEGCEALGLELPRLVVEPGRSLVGRAGVALYTAGVIKDIPGVRRYVSVDGGMADNIRPALYGARQEAVVANRMLDADEEVVTVAGKFCEPGDVLIHDIKLPRVAAGDVLAVAGCGAYCLTEAMNYNASGKPPVIMVHGG
jgi:diaminopimelate decarboxylase